jgi:mannitol-1-phosphate 5-dehydrogenase
MPAGGTRTFVGFGFGAIQAGLFLYEAQRSGAFTRLVVAEVLPEVVAEVRRAGGVFGLNVARAGGIEPMRVGPVEIYDPGQGADRQQLIEAVAQAQEMATAVPSVQQYASAGPGSLHSVLAEGLRRKAAEGGPAAVVYAAENHTQAAAMLAKHVLGATPAGERAGVQARVRFLDTVIGKMSGVHSGGGLLPVAPGSTRAFLVEAFNHILVSRIRFDDGAFVRGIEVFEEKDDLLPFEEAKLYGHNAVHALAAYMGAVRGVETIAALTELPGMLAFLRAALVEESGAALVRKYAGVDAYFTSAGYAAAADDLLARMVNPYLRDTVARVGRDPARKLGWDDRLVGAMRLIRGQGITSRRYALGVVAALRVLGDARPAEVVLHELWAPAQHDPVEEQAILALVADGVTEFGTETANG